MNDSQRVIVSFAPEKHLVGQVRRFGTAQLRRWNLSHLTETAELLISELVTNAVVHGKGPDVCVSLAHAAGRLHIEVTDGSPHPPHLHHPGPDEEHGRGLLLVQALSHRWGTSEDGRQTWCTLLARDG
ncbi:ATP-binding protein [Streptomyces sp. NPDC003077]|uniref:ATP-binding protein n=1 Tax=Streptomyces sp. NPDC003077 TaxID=3154443 RepID=UPI0033AAF9D0